MNHTANVGACGYLGFSGCNRLVRRIELAAVDGVGAGGADAPCRHVGEGALGAGAAHADRAGGRCCRKGISGAGDGCTGSANGGCSNAARTQSDVACAGSCRCAISNGNITCLADCPGGGAVAQRHRALAYRLVGITDGHCAAGLIGCCGGSRAIAVGDIVGAGHDRAGTACKTWVTDGDCTVAIRRVAHADTYRLAAGCGGLFAYRNCPCRVSNRTSANGNRVIC